VLPGNGKEWRMKEEFSAGAVVCRKNKHEMFFLLVQNKETGSWGFPAENFEPVDQSIRGSLWGGFFNIVEGEREAALGAVKRMTGIGDLMFVRGFRETYTETVVTCKDSADKAETRKYSLYFLLETGEKEVAVDRKEIAVFRWVRLYEAEKLFTAGQLTRYKSMLVKAIVFSGFAIDENARWKKIAIDHFTNRYVLDVARSELPYYQVELDKSVVGHIVRFVVPWDPYEPEIKDIIDIVNPGYCGPYSDYVKAIKGDSKKRGLPSEFEKEEKGNEEELSGWFSIPH
jgi:hypothetical protein